MGRNYVLIKGSLSPECLETQEFQYLILASITKKTTQHEGNVSIHHKSFSRC